MRKNVLVGNLVDTAHDLKDCVNSLELSVVNLYPDRYATYLKEARRLIRELKHDMSKLEEALNTEVEK